MSYTDTIAEAAYKKAIHSKPSTDSSLAFFEESGWTDMHTSIDSLWLDTKYIPDTAPAASAFKDGIYYASVNGSSIAVLKKVSAAVTAVAGARASYQSSELKGCIPPYYKNGYEVTVTDGNGEQIPFGLNRWILDTDTGILSFLDGFPDGYNSSGMTVSAYVYAGRTGSGNLISSDGLSGMLETYVPSKPTDVVTKSYADEKSAAISGIVKNLTPGEPETFSGYALTLQSGRTTAARNVLTNEQRDIVLEVSEFTLDFPRFYNPCKGRLSLWCGDQMLNQIELSSGMAAGASGAIVIDYSEDYYKNTDGKRGFYEALKLHCALSASSLRPYYSSASPKLSFCIKYAYGSTSYQSADLVIGIDQTTESAVLSESAVTGTGESFVSGIPVVPAGKSIVLSGNLSCINWWKPDSIARLTSGTFGEDKEIAASETYASVNPSHALSESLTVAKGMKSDSFSLTLTAYNVFKEVSGSFSYTGSLILDGISDETERVTSGSGAYPESWGLAFDSSQNIASGSELMLLYGLYQWPSGNYTGCGKVPGQSKSSWSSGPDYSGIKDGTRYAAFCYDLDWTNSIRVSFPQSEGLSQNGQTHALLNGTMQIAVPGYTGWLDGTVPCDGIHNPSSDGDGALVVHSSGDNLFVITFGKTPVKGKCYIRIGIGSGSRFKFSRPDVQVN